LETVDYTDLQGLFAKMPWTMAGFVLAAFSIIGVPPTCGFFSKWYLVIGAIDSQNWVFAAALLLSSLLTAVIFFKILVRIYFGDSSESHPSTPGTLGSLDPSFNEAPLSMLLPTGIMAIGVLTLGFFSGKIISSVIQFTVPGGF